jgi:hypothetical protein
MAPPPASISHSFHGRTAFASPVGTAEAHNAAITNVITTRSCLLLSGSFTLSAQPGRGLVTGISSQPGEAYLPNPARWSLRILRPYLLVATKLINSLLISGIISQLVITQHT